jgi:sulfopyruvate decarboxylase subunit beta
MTRAEAMAAVLDLLPEAVVVAANGFLSREAFALRGGRPDAFFMIGSMGLAGVIGLGIALARPERRVLILDGDGNVLMGLGGLAMVAERRPANLLHVVLDNRSYASTGGQRSISDRAPLEEVARGAGYAVARRVRPGEDLAAAVEEAERVPGPAFLLVEVDSGPATAPRVALAPEEIAARFRAALTVTREKETDR